MRLVIYAPGIHTGGGKVLILDLLRHISAQSCLLFLDHRLDISGTQTVKDAIYLKTGWRFRLQNEIALKRRLLPGDHLICLANLPPFFNPPCRTTILLQNRLIFDWRQLPPSSTLRWKMRFSCFLFSFFLRKKDLLWVQTESMATLVKSQLRKRMNQVWVQSFMDIEHYKVEMQNFKKMGSNKAYDFLSVLGFEPHKNLHMLIDAWTHLKGLGIEPSLHLVLNGTPVQVYELGSKIQRLKLNISVATGLNHAETLKCYTHAQCLVHTSSIESFGLPLIEASRVAEIEIIAPEVGYVRDLLDPSQTFEANSPSSLTRAILRHLKCSHLRLPILAPSQIIQKLETATFYSQ